MTLQTFHGFLLWLTITWPLVLAFPAVHRSIPACRQLALLPAVALLLWPDGSWLELPGFLLGTELRLEGDVRWILAMAVPVWLLAAQLESRADSRQGSAGSTVFFMITLAGHLGAILASELVGFFVFSTLMGYGFYGLVMSHRRPPQNAARLYVMALVLADLALFEALLLAAFSVGDLHYGAVSRAVGSSESANLYIFMVLLGFMLRAGIWPLHVWQWRMFTGLPVAHRLLLVAAPLATGWLGLLRWLPVGMMEYTILGWLLLALGVMAMVYALARFWLRPAMALLPAWLSVAIGGLVLALLGGALAWPLQAQPNEFLAHALIALLAVLLAVSGLLIAHRFPPQPDNEAPGPQRLSLTPVRAWTDSVLSRLSVRFAWFNAAPARLRLRLQEYVERLRQSPARVLLAIGWRVRMTLFLLLLLALALLMI